MKSKSTLSFSLFASLSATAALAAIPASTRAGEIFVENFTAGTIGEYDATTGATMNASLVTGLPTPLDNNGIAVSGGDLFVGSFGLSGDGTIGEYDATTGAAINASLVTGFGGSAAIAVSGGDLFATYPAGNAVDFAVGEYDATTGATINASLVTGLPSVLEFDGIAVSGGDVFVTSDSGSNGGTIGEYDATTGAPINASLVTGLAGFPGIIALSGGDLFVVYQHLTVSERPYGPPMIGEYNASTGATINASLVAGLLTVGGIAVSGNDLFVSSGTTIGEYDATTGAPINASLVTGLSGALGIVVVAPEPSAWVMLLIGGAGLVACCRRSRRSPEGPIGGPHLASGSAI